MDSQPYKGGFNKWRLTKSATIMSMAVHVIKATIPKGKASSVKAEAAARGISVSQLIIDALENCYGLDLGK